MTAGRWVWWTRVALVYAGLIPLLALGNLAGGDDGPLSGKLVAVGAAFGVALAIVGGVRLRLEGRQRLGSSLIALGMFPASVLSVFLWFPPIAAIGILALVVTVSAATDALESNRAATPMSS